MTCTCMGDTKTKQEHDKAFLNTLNTINAKRSEAEQINVVQCAACGRTYNLPNQVLRTEGEIK